MLAVGTPSSSDAGSPARAAGTAAVQGVLDAPKLGHTRCRLGSTVPHSDTWKEETSPHLLYVEHNHFCFESQVPKTITCYSWDPGNWAEDTESEKHRVVLKSIPSPQQPRHTFINSLPPQRCSENLVCARILPPAKLPAGYGRMSCFHLLAQFIPVGPWIYIWWTLSTSASTAVLIS